MLARRLSTALLVLVGFLSSAAVSNAVELRLLPPNTEIVITINVKQILASDLVKSQAALVKQVKGMLEQQIPGGGADAIKALEKMGFDPMKDLTSVTIAHPGSADPKDVFIILEGVYDPAKIEAAAQDAIVKFGTALKITKIGTTTVYEIRPDPDTVIYAGLVSAKSMVFTGSPGAMKGAIARSNSAMIAATKVKDLLKTTNDKQSFNFVMTSKAILAASDLAQKAPGGKKIPADAVNQAMQDIDGISGTVTIGKDVDIMLGVGFKAADKAKEIVDLGNGSMLFVKAMVAKQAQVNPQLAPVVDFVDTLKLSSNGSTAVVTGSFSNANVQKLLKDLGNMLK